MIGTTTVPIIRITVHTYIAGMTAVITTATEPIIATLRLIAKEHMNTAIGTTGAASITIIITTARTVVITTMKL